jgi:hypothetical protein
MKQKIDSAIKDQISNTWQQTLQGLDTTNTKDTWRITKSLTNTGNKIPPLKHNGNVPITNQDKVNIFADTLGEIFQTNPYVDTNRLPDATSATPTADRSGTVTRSCRAMR